MSSVVVKKASNPTGLLLVVILFVAVPGFLLLASHYEPVSSGTFQVTLLSFLHQGIKSDTVNVMVEGCVSFAKQKVTPRPDGVLVQETTEYLAVRKQVRTIIFGDRSKLEITFSEPYYNPQCLGPTP